MFSCRSLFWTEPTERASEKGRGREREISQRQFSARLRRLPHLGKLVAGKRASEQASKRACSCAITSAANPNQVRAPDSSVWLVRLQPSGPKRVSERSQANTTAERNRQTEKRSEKHLSFASLGSHTDFNRTSQTNAHRHTSSAQKALGHLSLSLSRWILPWLAISKHSH